MSQISDDARKMRDYIIEHGWIAGDYQDEHSGAACIVGAMNLVRGNTATWTSDSWYASFKTDATYNAIREYLDVTFVGNDWNDTPGRTKQEVLDMLENVAIKYDDDAYTSGANDD